jgi:glycosyltransferase involved in cell wall biosynthesis
VEKKRGKLVITIVDMIPEIFASELDRNGTETLAKRKAVEAADAIICISECTKRDLQERYAVPDCRITVTPLASHLSREMAFGLESVPEQPYVLFIGHRWVYKNFARALLALDRIAAKWPELVLCVVGEVLSPSEVELIRALNLIARIRPLGVVSDTQLAKLYRCSEGLLYPSLYEGFGMPPLEAMSCGTVVISSNGSSLPEVVGDAAILINPESVEEIAAALLSLRDLGSRRPAMIEQGFVRASKFSWDETARRTVELYRSLK